MKPKELFACLYFSDPDYGSTVTHPIGRWEFRLKVKYLPRAITCWFVKFIVWPFLAGYEQYLIIYLERSTSTVRYMRTE